MPSKKLIYPRLPRRIEAAILDSVVIMVVFFSAAFTLARFEIPGQAKLALFLLIVFILEPVLVGVWGSTIGHRLRGLQVVDTHSETSVGIPRAILRFLARLLLGLPSLIFILVTQRRQALHDLLVRSTVIVRNAENFASVDLVSEEPIEKEGYKYPPKWRRILVIALYNTLILVFFGTLGALFLSDRCLLNDQCSQSEEFFSFGVGLGWLILFGASIFYGWRGRLFGCRREQLQ